MHNVDELKKQYKLSDEDNERIFNEYIKPLVFGQIKPSIKPAAIFGGGQSGSGKFSVMSCAARENNNICIITADDYKPFHPQSEYLKKTYPVEYVPIVDQDAGIWTAKALKYAIENRYSFIFEGTFKNDRVIERMKECKENGFRVEVKVMATSSLESLLSIFERYEKEIEYNGTGRLVSIKQHDEAYNNIINTIKNILNSGYCDAINVYGRGISPFNPKYVFSSSKGMSNFLDSVDYIENERVVNEKNTINTISSRISKLNEQMSNRKISETEYLNYEMLLKRMSNYLVLKSDSGLKK